MTQDILGQCAECQYTETLDLNGRGRITTTTTIRRAGAGLIHSGCGGPIRLWTGKPYSYRVRGVQ